MIVVFGRVDPRVRVAPKSVEDEVRSAFYQWRNGLSYAELETATEHEALFLKLATVVFRRAGLSVFQKAAALADPDLRFLCGLVRDARAAGELEQD